MKILLTTAAIAAAALITPFTPASGAVTDLQTIVSAQNPAQWLQFGNNLTNSGSGSAVFNSSGGDFGADANGVATSSRSFSASFDEVSTTTDVIAGKGSLSLLFRVPDIAFTGDRYLFDGGVDNVFEDDSFQLRWSNSNQVLQLKMGNDTFPLNGPNIQAAENLGKWFYFGTTWDDTNNSQEGTAVYGLQGGTLSSTPLNPANASVVGDNGPFYIGNREDEDFNSAATSAWRQTGGATGFIDEFAIWDSALEVGQLEAQFNYFNGNIPDPPPAGVIYDGFDDGSRAIVPSGINWYAIGGTTTSGRQKPGLSVKSDNGAGGIGDGPALFVVPEGSTDEIMGVLGEEVALGAVVGSTLSTKFDMRLLDTVPDGGEFRFGLYADTDNEFGTNGWGESDGNFDRQNPGAGGDSGVFARVQFGPVTGSDVRIAEEAPNPNGDVILGGSGTDQIAGADRREFATIDNLDTHSFELLFTRVAPSPTGETVQVTLVMSDGSTTSTLVGLDGLTSSSDTSATPSIFEYFAATTTTEIDWVLDNFQLEVIEATSTPGDFDGDGDVDGADFLTWQRNPGVGDLADWQTFYGAGSPLSAANSSVPEPTSLALLSLCGVLAVSRRR